MNVAVAGKAPLSFDRRARSNTLCAAADGAIGKGDLELAHRLLVQADVDDPRNPDTEQRLAALDREIARFDVFKATAKPEGRKFDFLYAPTLRGLSTELSTVLPLHPDMFSVSKTELDDAIIKTAEPGLLAKYQRQVLNGHANLKTGLVQHSFIAGQLAGPEVAERLAGITTRHLFIHGVRDPVSIVVSDFNNELVGRHCGSFSFWPVDPQTPFCRLKYDLAGSPRYKGRRSRGIPQASRRWLGNYWLGQSGPMRKLLEESLTRPRHYAVGQTYAQHFEQWIPVNLERPAPPQPDVLSRIFEAIGVDSRYKHPAFAVSEGTTVHRLMVKNWIAVDAFGHLLFVGLGFADRAMFSNTFLMSEMLAFEPDERFAAVGAANHTLCVTVLRAQWRLLPRDVRVRLVESDELRRFRDAVLIPAWLESCARWKATMSKYLLRQLEPALLSRLRAEVGADLERFLKRHPQFEKAWPSTGALLG
jgi:hypothetical protein